MAIDNVILVEEGDIQLYIPKLNESITPLKSPVFYNPRMQLSRDVSVIALQAYQRSSAVGLHVCDAMSGCGVRGIRYAVEVKGVEQVDLNDLNPLAVDLMKKNVEINNVGRRSVIHNYETNHLLAMYAEPGSRFDVVDIDPFGSPSPYLDTLIRATKKGGLIMITATDLAPLSGVHPMACQRKYGGQPLNTEYVQETAIRLVVSALVRSAAVHSMAFHPLLCYYQDYYVRVIGTISYGSKITTASLKNIGFILHCNKCLNRETVKGNCPVKKECGRCGQRLKHAGPLWLGDLFDAPFLSQMELILPERSYKSINRIQRLITDSKEEVTLPPTYFLLDSLCDKLGLPLPKPVHVKGILVEQGYKAGRSHIHGNAIKTDAPIDVLEDAVRKALS